MSIMIEPALETAATTTASPCPAPYPFRRRRELGATELVVSYCTAPLAWLKGAVDDLTCLGASVSRVHVVCKCGRRPNASEVPSGATVRSARNVGRNDHTFADFIATRYDTLPASIFFLKDTSAGAAAGPRSGKNTPLPIHLVGSELQASEDGFACGSEPPTNLVPRERAQSLWHAAHEADEFRLVDYHREHEQSRLAAQSPPFSSPSRPLWRFVKTTFSRATASHLDSALHPLRLVCYGGTFATTATSVHRQSRRDWRALRNALTRGDNIEEGHYTERLWAALLTAPASAEEAASALLGGAGRGGRDFRFDRTKPIRFLSGVALRDCLPGLIWQHNPAEDSERASVPIAAAVVGAALGALAFVAIKARRRISTGAPVAPTACSITSWGAAH